MNQKEFLILILIIVALSAKGFGTTWKDTIETNEGMRTSSERDLWISLDIGSQLGSSYETHLKDGFDSGVYFKFNFLALPANDGGEFSIGFVYWHGPSNRLMVKSDDGMGGEVAFLFHLINIKHFVFSIGPRLGIENVNHARGGVFNYGGIACAAFPIADGLYKIKISTLFQLGGELFAIGGGGYTYSFPAITLGLAANIGKLFTKIK